MTEQQVSQERFAELERIQHITEVLPQDWKDLRAYARIEHTAREAVVRLLREEDIPARRTPYPATHAPGSHRRPGPGWWSGRGCTPSRWTRADGG